jgi:5-methylcytosine-specific restriction endonuclease McrA
VNRVSCHSMLYDISPVDFAHHVRHATSWNDLGVLCGLEKDKHGSIRNHCKLSMIHQKVNHMRLNTDHFCGQKPPISDDDFKKIVLECYSVRQIMMKCKIESGGSYEKILKRIEDLDIDISHLKKMKKRTIYKSGGKLEAIDDETFKTLVKDNMTWRNLSAACGYSSDGVHKKIASRIEKLGLDTNHFDKSSKEMYQTDKVFVVDSDYLDNTAIKKRLLTEFNFPYECAGCQNQNFTKGDDGVLMWNKQKIVLQLEHKNGINNDNSIQNLELLCPNCHSQTSTYAGGNNKKSKTIQIWLEQGKTCHAPGSVASLLN